MNEAEIITAPRCGNVGQKAKPKASVHTECVRTTSSFDNRAHASWAKNHTSVPRVLGSQSQWWLEREEDTAVVVGQTERRKSRRGDQAAGWGEKRKSAMGRGVEVDKNVTIWTLWKMEVTECDTYDCLLL